MQDTTEIYCYIKHQTDGAVLIDEGDKELWVPRSQIDVGEEIKTHTNMLLNITTWFAKQKGLI